MNGGALDVIIFSAGFTSGRTGLNESFTTTPLSTTFSTLLMSSKKMTIALFIREADLIHPLNSQHAGKSSPHVGVSASPAPPDC